MVDVKTALNPDVMCITDDKIGDMWVKLEHLKERVYSYFDDKQKADALSKKIYDTQVSLNEIREIIHDQYLKYHTEDEFLEAYDWYERWDKYENEINK